MDSFIMTFTCTCGERAEEYFLNSTGSRAAMIQLFKELIEAGVDDATVVRNRPDGTTRDETPHILLALAITGWFEE